MTAPLLPGVCPRRGGHPICRLGRLLGLTGRCGGEALSDAPGLGTVALPRRSSSSRNHRGRPHAPPPESRVLTTRETRSQNRGTEACLAGGPVGASVACELGHPGRTPGCWPELGAWEGPGSGRRAAWDPRSGARRRSGVRCSAPAPRASCSRPEPAQEPQLCLPGAAGRDREHARRLSSASLTHPRRCASLTLWLVFSAEAFGSEWKFKVGLWKSFWGRICECGAHLLIAGV